MKARIYRESPEQLIVRPDPLRRTLLRGIGGATIGAAMPWTISQALATEGCNLTNFAGDIEYGRPPAMTNRIPMEIDGKRYYRNEINDWWAVQCRGLPCFHGVCFRGYAERVLKNFWIGDRYAIVHLWKGWCQKFLGTNDHPGGMGVEIGVYLVQPSAWVKRHPVPGTVWDRIGALAAIAKAARDLPNPHKWYPAYEIPLKMRFQLVDPDSGEIIFSTKEKSGYWCTEWMEKDAYHAWEKCRKGGSINATHLTVEYWINDGEKHVWKYENSKRRDDFHCIPGHGYKGDFGPVDLL
jgi:hypothetical protein